MKNDKSAVSSRIFSGRRKFNNNKKCSTGLGSTLEQMQKGRIKQPIASVNSHSYDFKKNYSVAELGLFWLVWK